MFRRFAILLLLASPAWARDATPSPASTGRRVVNLTEYGATNGKDSAGRVVDNGILLQRAIDDLKAFAGSPPKGGVILLDEVYHAWTTVFADLDNLTIRSSGAAGSGGMAWYTCGPGLALVKRDPGGVKFPTDVRVDSFGIADASLAPRAAAWWGYHTAPASQPDTHVHAAAPWTTLTLGRSDDGHASTRALTIEVLVETPTPPGNGLRDSRPLFGGSEGKAGLGQLPAPFLVWATSGGTYELRITLEGGTVKAIPIPAAGKGNKAPPGVTRLCWQVDLDAGKVLLFRDGLGVGSAPLPPGARLMPVEYAPFNLGGVDFYALSFGGDRPDNGDFTFHGLKVTDSLAYADSGDGQPQTRLDGYRVNDLSRFGPDAKALGRFKGDLLPASPLLCPFVCADAGGSTGNADAHLVNWASSPSRSGGTPYAIVGTRLDGIAITQSGSNAFNGTALATFDVRSLAVTDSRLDGRAYGACGLGLNTNAYPLTATRSSFQGGDAGMAAVGWHLWLRDCSVPYAGRFGAIFHGSTIDWDGGWWGGVDWTRTLAIWRIKAGTGVPSYSFRHIAIDNELPTRAMLGLVWADAAGSTRVEIDGVNLYQMSPDTRLAHLASGGPSAKGSLLVRNCPQLDGLRALVTVAGAGARWAGTIEGFIPGRRAGEPWEMALPAEDPATGQPAPTTVAVEYRDGSERTSGLRVNPAPGPAGPGYAPPAWNLDGGPTPYARSKGRARPVAAPAPASAP